MARAGLIAVVLIAAVTLSVTSWRSHDREVVPVSVVKRVLTTGHLEPQKVKVVTTIEAATQAPLPAVNFCAAEAVEVPYATSLDVDHGRAIVMVFESPQAADEWTPRADRGEGRWRGGGLSAGHAGQEALGEVPLQRHAQPL